MPPSHQGYGRPVRLRLLRLGEPHAYPVAGEPALRRADLGSPSPLPGIRGSLTRSSPASQPAGGFTRSARPDCLGADPANTSPGAAAGACTSLKDRARSSTPSPPLQSVGLVVLQIDPVAAGVEQAGGVEVEVLAGVAFRTGEITVGRETFGATSGRTGRRRWRIVTAAAYHRNSPFGFGDCFGRFGRLAGANPRAGFGSEEPSPLIREFISDRAPRVNPVRVRSVTVRGARTLYACVGAWC